MSIDTISEGCTLLMSTPGMPSTTTSGPLRAESDVPPRRRMLAPASGAPELCTMLMPATLPCSSCSVEVMTPCFMSLACTEAMAPVRSDLRMVP
jgi:hypothetical protein